MNGKSIGMRRAALAAFAAFLSAGLACRKKSSEPLILETWESHARLRAPSGWRRRENSFGPDRAVRFTNGAGEIRVQLLGGPGSRYSEMAAFMKDLGQSREEQSPARPSGAVKIAGQEVRLYERFYFMYAKYPHSGSPDREIRAREVFCLLPAGSRFFALSYSAPAPADSGKGTDPAWPEFLRAFEIVRPY